MPRVEELDPRSLAPDRTGRRRLRVLLSAFECAPGIGSESEVGWRWAVEIARLGHDVVVLTWSRDRALLEAARAAGKVPASVRFEYVMPAWLEALRARGLPLQLVHLSWQLAAYLHARKLIGRERFDLVHHITYCVIRQPSFMGRLPLPFVLGPVGGGETAPFALRRGMGARGWLLDLVRDGLNLIARLDPITRGALRQARLIYVSSPDTARLVPDGLQGKVRVRLQIGIDAREIGAGPGDRHMSGELRLLYVGRCLAWKGMHLGLEALARLRARGCPARLTIAGSGAAERHWRAAAHRLELDDAVDWLSWVEHRRMPEVYRAHDLLLFPSLHDFGRPCRARGDGLRSAGGLLRPWRARQHGRSFLRPRDRNRRAVSHRGGGRFDRRATAAGQPSPEAATRPGRVQPRATVRLAWPSCHNV